MFEYFQGCYEKPETFFAPNPRRSKSELRQIRANHNWFFCQIFERQCEPDFISPFSEYMFNFPKDLNNLSNLLSFYGKSNNSNLKICIKDLAKI